MLSSKLNIFLAISVGRMKLKNNLFVTIMQNSSGKRQKSQWPTESFEVAQSKDNISKNLWNGRHKDEQ